MPPAYLLERAAAEAQLPQRRRRARERLAHRPFHLRRPQLDARDRRTLARSGQAPTTRHAEESSRIPVTVELLCLMWNPRAAKLVSQAMINATLRTY